MGKSLWKLATCVVVILLSFSLYSCGNDNEEDTENNECLIGTWEETDCKSYKNGVVVPNHWSKNISWTFKQNGSLEHFSSTYKDYGSYTINGKSLTISYEVKDWKGSWNEKYTVEIISLTESELIWKEIYPDDEYDYEILTLEKTN
ncbi:lipocalin family protein [Bacteroides finegoldii]|uniref:lipocalin family protein n=1 Tax=Bacteroides finegoldii TaxID=338188 RepID=UPI00189CCEB5|nr:lipocalin family protein [Bacteroides finegoldii]